MGSDRTENIKTAAALYCDVVLYFSFLVLRDTFAGAGGHSGRALAVWLLSAMLVYGVNCRLLKKERELGSLIVANLAVGVPAAAAVFYMMGPYASLWQMAFTAVGIIFIHCRIVNRFFDRVTVDGCIRAFEVSVCLITGYVLFKSLYEIDASTGPFLMSSVIASVASVIAARLENAENLGSGQGRTGLLVVFSLIAALAAACTLFGVYFSDTAGEIIRGSAATAAGIAATVMRLLGKLVTALLMLLPEGEYGEYIPEPQQSIGLTAEELPELSYDPGPAAVLLAAALVSAALICAFLKLRHLKLSVHKKRPVRKAAKAESTGFAGMIRHLLEAVRRSLRRLIGRLSIRNTPAGSALSAERMLKYTRYSKSEGETYPAYMRRLADELKAEDVNQASMLLVRLADEFDRQFFAGAAPVTLSRTETAVIKRAVRQLAIAARADSSETE